MTETRDYLERRWWALVLLCMTQFMVVLDASIVNIALPSIGTDVGISQENLSWVVNGYVLTFGGFLLLGGRLADLLGRRLIFMVGLLIVAVASLFAGFAPNEGTLIAARAAQGLGAAIIAPSALSIVTTIFRDGSERNKALGAWGAVAGSGGAAGVLLGGVLTDGLGWEWVMWVNGPLVPFRIFNKRTLTGANAVGLMVGGSLFAMFFFITLYMQQVLDYSPIKAGLSYLPLALAIILSAGVAPHLLP